MRTPRTDDIGQMMIGLVSLLAVAMVALVFLAVVPIGAATDERSRSQTAADAAALAGALELRGVAVPAGGLGAAQARAYAEANDAELIFYQVDAATGEVQVRVRNTYRLDAEQDFAESTATAELALVVPGSVDLADLQPRLVD